MRAGRLVAGILVGAVGMKGGLELRDGLAFSLAFAMGARANAGIYSAPSPDVSIVALHPCDAELLKNPALKDMSSPVRAAKAALDEFYECGEDSALVVATRNLECALPNRPRNCDDYAGYALLLEAYKARAEATRNPFIHDQIQPAIDLLRRELPLYSGLHFKKRLYASAGTAL